MIHVFIDTNIYLEFYGFATDDLEELRKLRAAVDAGEMKLWTTDQVADELSRKRDAKIAEAAKWLRELTPSDSIPQLARNLSGFDDFRDARRNFAAKLNELEEQLMEQAAATGLAADAVLGEVLNVAERIAVNDDLLDRARNRVDRGNPPGKKGALGDAINWEALLDAFPPSEDLCLVTADRDFASRIDSDRIADYLAGEWQDHKSAQVHLYKRISAFSSEHLPDADLAVDLERALRVQSLAHSPSFDETHRRIARLAEYSDFDDAQVRQLVTAALRNSQIAWIAGDPDVKAFFRSLIEGREGLVEADELERFQQQFFPERELESTVDDDIPF